MFSAVTLPVDELKNAGEKLQQSIALTRVRAENFPNARIKARALREVMKAQALFDHVSSFAQASQRLTGFVQSAFGVTVDDLFGAVPNERAARGAAYTGMALVIKSVEGAIDGLAKVNRDMNGAVNDNCNQKN